MANNFDHVSHIKSRLTREIQEGEFYGLTPSADNSDGQGSSPIKLNLAKRPTADKLIDGEIAVNYLKGHETLTIKNTEDEIVGFVNENEFNQAQEIIASGLAQEKNERTEEVSRIEQKVDSCYTKEEVDTALALKADKSEVETFVTEEQLTQEINTINTALGNKADKSVVDELIVDVNDMDYTVSNSLNDLNGRIDNIGSVVNNVEYVKNDKKIYFKFNNDIVDEIDTTDFIKDGMVENVKIENGNLVVTFNTDAGKETIEIPLTSIFNPQNYYTKSDVNTALALKADKSELVPLATKAEVETVDAKVEAIDLTPYATKQEVETVDEKVDAINTTLTLKADKSDTYTKSEVDTALGNKADKASTYTKTEVDTALALKADKTVVDELIDDVNDMDYTVSSSLNDLNDRILANETALSKKADKISTYTKEEVNNELTNYYNKTAVDNLLLNKADVSTLSNYVSKTELETVTTDIEQTEKAISISLNDLDSRISSNVSQIENLKSENASLRQIINNLTARIVALENS